MVGRNILEHPTAKLHEIYAPTRQEVDLLDFKSVYTAVQEFKPDLIIHTAGLVGGIQANMSAMFNFMEQNIAMGLNVVKAARDNSVPRLINLGSTCMYPDAAKQPLVEESLLTGPLEPTNEGYGLAKSTIQRACQYISKENKNLKYKTYIPCNLVGRWDHFDPEKSHLLPAIIRKMHNAFTEQRFEIEIWGDGTPKREFMDAADLADFIFFSLTKFDEVPDVINVSTGYDLTISEIYQRIADILLSSKDRSKVTFTYDSSRPNGMVRKLSDITKQTKLGWSPKTSFESTISKTYDFFIGEEFPGNKMTAKQQTAFITGVTGQDGSYLAEFLLAKGYRVIGMARRNSQPQHSWLKPIYEHPSFVAVYGNMEDASSLWRALQQYQPDEIYNLAAQSHVRVSFDCPEETFDVVAMGTLRLLNAARSLVPNARIYQAGSSEQFGFNPKCPQDELTSFMPASPYACAKVAAHNICINYREAYKMFISVGLLHNHESPRRGDNFVTRKITKAVANIKIGKQDKLYLGNLEAKRDWGYAKEYVELMWRILQHPVPEDFVIATGESHSVKEFLQATFEEADLDWTQHVVFDPNQVRPHEVNHLEGDASKAKRLLGWEPKVRFRELAKIMYEHDLLETLKVSLTDERQRKLLKEFDYKKDAK